MLADLRILRRRGWKEGKERGVGVLRGKFYCILFESGLEHE